MRFRREWTILTHIAVTETLVERADALAWEYGLRGYDAVQFASAEAWRSATGGDMVLATLDRALWDAAASAGFEVWPAKLTA